jgi:hypothetical protein
VFDVNSYRVCLIAAATKQSTGSYLPVFFLKDSYDAADVAAEPKIHLYINVCIAPFLLAYAIWRGVLMVLAEL